MTLENLGLVQKWRRYAGPKDERLEAESCRIYRTGFLLLAFGMLAFFLFDIMQQQARWIHDLSATSAPGLFSSPILTAMFIWFLIAMIACVVMQIRKGFIDSNRFGQTDSFPKRYFALVSTLSGIGCAVILFLLRSVAELQVVPVQEVFWIQNIFIGIASGALIFAATFLAFYLSFREAKKSRQRIERELDNED